MDYQIHADRLFNSNRIHIHSRARGNFLKIDCLVGHKTSLRIFNMELHKVSFPQWYENRNQEQEEFLRIPKYLKTELHDAEPPMAK